jgi:hypothetical protein
MCYYLYLLTPFRALFGYDFGLERNTTELTEMTYISHVLQYYTNYDEQMLSPCMRSQYESN